MENKKIYVWCGSGYRLDDVDLSTYENDDICIDELCYLCKRQGIGWIIPFNELSSDEIKQYENDESFAYCDISNYLENSSEENQYFMCIQELKAFNIEIHS